MKDGTKEIDDAVERYRDEMAAEASLAGRDLAEIEDHLRLLIDELRASMPLAAAIVEACERMGPPGAVAREHARVRTAFGARLSRARAWSAVAMLAPFLALRSWGIHLSWDVFGEWHRAAVVLEVGLGAMLMVALAFRLTWARAFVLGTLPIGMVSSVMALSVTGAPFHAAYLAAQLGAFACLVPWRRGELTAPGRGLALMAPAYVGGSVTLMSFSPDLALETLSLVHLLGPLAFAAVLTGALGGLLRARWAAPVTAAAAVLLLIGTFLSWTDGQYASFGNFVVVLMLAVLLASVAAATLAAVIQWRTAHSTVGTLRCLR